MKKLATYVMLIAILAFAITGCGNKKIEETTDKDTKISDTKKIEPEIIRMVMKDLSPSNEEHVKYIEKVEDGLKKQGINVKIELTEMPPGTYAEKLNLMLLDQDIPDIIYFQGGDQQMVNQGLLEDLTPYIEKSSIVKNRLEAFNKARMESYPYLLWIKPVATKVPVVRQDWFNELDISKELVENPSIDNYYKLFKEITDKKSKYGITVAGDISKLDNIFNQAFGLENTWMLENGEYIYSKITSNEKEKIEFYAKLYKDGLLDPEYLTKKWDTKEQAFYSGEAGVILGTSGKVVDIYDGNMKKQNGDDSTIMVLPPAKGKEQGYLPYNITKESRGIAISTTSKKKDLAWSVIEFLVSDEGQYIDRLGIEGVHYNVENEKITLTDKAQNWFAYFFEVTKWKPEMEMTTPLLGKSATKSLEMATQYYSNDNVFVVPEELLTYEDAIKNLYNEWTAEVITGKKTIDSFDEFKEEWYKLGGNKLTEYANKTLKQ